jgi:FdrA protein
MATPANVESLREVGLEFDAATAATPEDIIIAVEATEDRCADVALDTGERLLTQPSQAPADDISTFPTTGAAVRTAPAGAVGLVSVPGDHAARETKMLTEAGYQVVVFSDNVTIEVEKELKADAAARGTAVFGPDCGTALIGGVGFGFVNQTQHGAVGIVAASGTGAQAVAVALDRLEVGVTHIVGVGGRDLTDEIGGAAMLGGLKALDDDPATQVIVLVAKQIGPSTLSRLLRSIADLSTPVVTCLFGQADAWVTTLVGAHSVNSLTAAATKAKAVLDGAPERGLQVDLTAVDAHRRNLGPDRVVRGAFAGGTLAYEAAQVLRPLIGEVSTDEPAVAGRHGIVDLGDDRYTRGQPHPMINPSLQADFICDQLTEAKANIILFDVVLGHGAHASPAEVLAKAVIEGRDRSRPFIAIATVVGTAADPQDLTYQREILADAGVAVFEESSRAAFFAGLVAATEPDDVAVQVVNLAPPAAVINVGARWFADAMSSQGVEVLHVDWHPPAQGDAELADMLDLLN